MHILWHITDMSSALQFPCNGIRTFSLYILNVLLSDGVLQVLCQHTELTDPLVADLVPYCADIGSADISSHFNSVYEFLAEAERLKQRESHTTTAGLCSGGILQLAVPCPATSTGAVLVLLQLGTVKVQAVASLGMQDACT